MRRFERIHDVVEPAEEYRHGGYHPVHLYDVFNGRYEVIGKLAFGQFSTVWLANDQRSQQQVALKILKADVSKNNHELSILRRLSVPDLEHPGRAHVLELLDYFEHDGPNGTHLCLVLPLQVSDGQAMTVGERPRQADYIRAISKQLLRGLDFLHTLGIVHCDLQPANILFTVPRVAQNKLLLQSPKFSVVRWLEGLKVDNSAPKYLMPSQRPRGQLSDADFSTLLLRIGDLGGAVCDQQFDTKPVTPTALRAPELICQNKWDASIDIWALSCLIFELATNEPLFPLGTFGLTAEQINQEHIHLINQIVGKNGEPNDQFAGYLQDRLPSDFGTKNIQQFVSFLSLMIQSNPQMRPPAAKLLEHPFLARGSGVESFGRD